MSAFWLIYQLAILIKEKFQNFNKLGVSYLNWIFVNILCFLYKSTDKNVTKYFYPLNSKINYYDSTELFFYSVLPILVLYFLNQYKIKYPEHLKKRDTHKINSNLIYNSKGIIIGSSKIIRAHLKSYYKFISDKIINVINQIKILVPIILKFLSYVAITLILAFSIIIFVQNRNYRALVKSYLSIKKDYKEITKYNYINLCSMKLQSYLQDDSLKFILNIYFCDTNFKYNIIENNQLAIFNLLIKTNDLRTFTANIKNINCKVQFTNEKTISGCTYEGAIIINKKDYGQINDWMVEIFTREVEIPIIYKRNLNDAISRIQDEGLRIGNIRYLDENEKQCVVVGIDDNDFENFNRNTKSGFMTKINLILGNVEYEDKWDIFFNKFKTAINSEDLDSIKVMMQNSDLLDKERYINNLIRRKESFALQYGNIKYTYIPRESCGIYDNIFKMINIDNDEYFFRFTNGDWKFIGPRPNL